MNKTDKTSTKYLNDNLLPLIESIQPKKSKSSILKALDLDRYSGNGILVTFGERIERFWNKVISDSSVKNLIEDNNMVEINNKNKQIDHLFLTCDGRKIYLESKCNLDFDSEKVKASNRKIQEIKEKVGADEAGYFNPVESIIDQKNITKYNNKGLNVYGVKWFLTNVDAPFSEEEFFTYLKEVIAPVLVEKGL